MTGDHVAFAVSALSLRPSAEAKRGCGHVECSAVTFGPDGEVQHTLQRHAAGIRFAGSVAEWSNHSAHQVDAKLLIAGRDGGVDREHGVALDAVKRAIKRLAGSNIFAGALDEIECRVALIEVVDRRVHAE